MCKEIEGKGRRLLRLRLGSYRGKGKTRKISEGRSFFPSPIEREREMGARNVGDRERAYGKSLKAFQGELHSGCRNSKTARLEKVRGKLEGEKEVVPKTRSMELGARRRIREGLSREAVRYSKPCFTQTVL